jgi:voltage-gated potassium channel
MIFGSLGYKFLEGYEFVDSLYMTVITITTVGFGHLTPLSQEGKIFTIFLIFGGVAFYGLTVNSIIQIIFQRGLKNFMEQARYHQKIKKLQNHVIICGGGRMAMYIADEFIKMRQSFIIIELDDSFVYLYEEKNLLYMIGSALDEENLIKAQIEKSSGLISVLATDADNLFVVLTARELRKDLNIITRISQESSRKKMKIAGATNVLSPYHLGGIQMARKMLHPDVDEFLEIMLDYREQEYRLNVKKIDEDHPLNGINLSNSNLRQKGYLVISIRKENGSTVFAPPSNTMIQKGDEIFLLSS